MTTPEAVEHLESSGLSGMPEDVHQLERPASEAIKHRFGWLGNRVSNFLSKITSLPNRIGGLITRAETGSQNQAVEIGDNGNEPISEYSRNAQETAVSGIGRVTEFLGKGVDTAIARFQASLAEKRYNLTNFFANSAKRPLLEKLFVGERYSRMFRELKETLNHNFIDTSRAGINKDETLHKLAYDKAAVQIEKQKSRITGAQAIIDNSPGEADRGYSSKTARKIYQQETIIQEARTKINEVLARCERKYQALVEQRNINLDQLNDKLAFFTARRQELLANMAA